MNASTIANDHFLSPANRHRAITKHAVRIIAASALVIGLGWSPASAQPTTSLDVPAVPRNLRVPPGNEAFLAGYALGTQNYICLATSTGAAWRFLGPQATLFLTSGGNPTQQITTHFLSVNPSESLARPTWQHSLDTSRVWGRVKASSSDPGYVERGAIDWLLVESAGVQLGPTGGNILAQTTFIHRLNTSGGVAPATGCSDVSQVGTVALVPYSTDYFFYRATR